MSRNAEQSSTYWMAVLLLFIYVLLYLLSKK